jgi:Mycothiol maleylpyruvate isomerase N-terminal domain
MAAISPGERDRAADVGAGKLNAAYLEAADWALGLLRDPAVAAAWQQASALPRWRVSGLAGHLSQQVLSVREVLAGPVPDAAPIGLFEHYARAPWVHADIDGDVNAGIRRAGDRLAADGPVAVADTVAAAAEQLRTELAAQPPQRIVHLPWVGWSLTLDDFLTTRMLEIAVHGDDIAVSAGIETPTLPGAVLDPVVALLSGLAVRRHGQAALLRAFARVERAPVSVVAI